MYDSVVSTDRTRAAHSVWYVTGLLFACWAIAYVDRMIVIILVPGIKGALHLSDTYISLLNGFAFSVFYALCGLPAGRLVDRLNRRNLLISSLIGWSVGTLACGLASNFSELFAARVVVGVSQAILAPASMSMVTDYCPTHLRGRTTGILVSGATVGAALASMLGGVLLDYFTGHDAVDAHLIGTLQSWQSTLIVAGLPGLVLAALMLTLREPDRRAASVDKNVEFLSIIWANRSVFIPLYASFVLTLVVGYGLASWYPVVLMRNLRMSPHAAGLVVGIVCLVGAVIAAVVGGGVSDWRARKDAKTGRLKFARILMLITAVGLLPLLLSGERWPVLVSFFAFSTVSTATSSIAYTVLPELVPNEARGQVIGLFLLMGYLLGFGLAPTAIAVITDAVLHDEMRVNVSMLVVAIPSLLLAALSMSIALPRVRRLRSGLATEDGP